MLSVKLATMLVTACEDLKTVINGLLLASFTT